MDALLWFLAVLLLCAPGVVAVVNTVADDAPKIGRGGKRLLAFVVSIFVAFAVQYVLVYAGLSPGFPIPIVAIGGVLLTMQAAGIYDISKLLGGNWRTVGLTAATRIDPYVPRE